jgi:hypothetical protein
MVIVGITDVALAVAVRIGLVRVRDHRAVVGRIEERVSGVTSWFGNWELDVAIEDEGFGAQAVEKARTAAKVKKEAAAKKAPARRKAH